MFVCYVSMLLRYMDMLLCYVDMLLRFVDIIICYVDMLLRFVDMLLCLKASFRFFPFPFFPFLVHLSQRLKCTIVITRCPSSVRRPSLTFHISTSPLKTLKGIQRNFTGSKISTSSTKFVFFGPIQKHDGRPSL